MKTRPNLGLAIVGGFVGTPPMTVGVYLLATLVHVKMNIVDALATMLGGGKMGMLVHVLNGAIVFPVAYAVFFYRFLLGPSYVKGLTFGLTLWLASVASRGPQTRKSPASLRPRSTPFRCQSLATLCAEHSSEMALADIRSWRHRISVRRWVPTD